MLASELNLIKSTIREYLKNFWNIIKAQIFVILLLSSVLPLSTLYSSLSLALENDLLISLSYSMITIANIFLFSYITTFILLFYRDPPRGIRMILREIDAYCMEIFLFFILLTIILFFPTICYYKKILDTVRNIKEYNIKNLYFLLRYFPIILFVSLFLAYIPAMLIEKRRISIKILAKGAYELAPYVLVFYCSSIYILAKGHLILFLLYTFFVSPLLNILYWKIYRERLQD